MNVLLTRRSTMLLLLTVDATVTHPASTFAAEQSTITLNGGETAQRVVLEETPIPDAEPGTVGAVTLAVVVYQGRREIGRFPIEGNQGELAMEWSSRQRPVVLAITRSCGGSCSSLYVTAVEVPSNGTPKEIFRRQFFGGAVAVISNGFIVSEPVYAEDEPNCCPSSERVSTFKRRGAGYELLRSRVRPKQN